MGRIRLFPLLFQNGCSQSSRFPTAGQEERGSGNEIVAGVAYGGCARSTKDSRNLAVLTTEFARLLEILESPGILLGHFPGLESPGKRPLVLESFGNLLNST